MDTLERDLHKAEFSGRARGGVMFKPLANFQFDRALELGVIDEACYAMGMSYPEVCACVYAVCERAA